MASPRNPDFDLATLPLNFTYIWLTPAQTFTALLEQTQDTNIKDYLILLLRYKKVLRSNNPKYNDNQYDEELSQILHELQSLLVRDLAPSFAATVKSLMGFVLRDLKRSEDALIHFGVGSDDDSVSRQSPLADALLYCNYMRTLNEQGHHLKASMYITHATKILLSLNPETTEMRHLFASAYADIANAFRRVENFSEAIIYYVKALVLWPEADVLNNRFAIYLSKVSTKETLLQAQGILEGRFEAAKKEHSFVTPYYLADVYIKLAAVLFENNDGQKKHYLNDAKEIIQVANSALFTNKNYNANYCFKSQARLALLEGHLYSALGMKEAAQAFYQKAQEYRAPVVEPAEKKAKFAEKFIPADKVFIPAMLFRRPVPAEITDFKKESEITPYASPTSKS